MTGPRGRAAMRTGVTAAGVALGALLAVGCALAMVFELHGFGSDRDAGPREWYVAALAIGLVACIAAPVALWRALRRPRGGP